MRVIAIYLVVDFFASLFQWILAEHRLNNLWTMHVYLPIQYGFSAWILSTWVRPKSRRFMRLSVIPFTIIWCICLLTFEDITRFSIVNKPFESALLVVMSLYVIYILNKETSVPLPLHPGFLFSACTLVYFVGVIMLFLLGNNILEVSRETLGNAWMIQSIIGIAKNVGYATTLLIPVSFKKNSVG